MRENERDLGLEASKSSVPFTVNKPGCCTLEEWLLSPSKVMGAERRKLAEDFRGPCGFYLE